MQTCRQYYHLHQQKVQSKLKDDSGVTLVELLAALTILTVVIILAGSIHMFGQKQFISQTDSASQSNDFSYALTDMTTEIRKKSSNEIKVNGEVRNQQILVNGSVVYQQVGSQLLKRGVSLADDVENFMVTKAEEYIEITLIKTNQTASNKNYQTRIYFRGE